MKKLLLSLGVITLVLTARASTVFDTFGPGNTYNSSRGYDVGSIPQAALLDISEAAQFTALASGNLTTVNLGLTYDQPDGFAAIPVNVYLAVGSSPFNPANETFLGSGTPTGIFGSATDSIASFAVAGTVSVTMGSTYWLVLKPASEDGLDIWNEALGPVPGMEKETYTQNGSQVFADNFTLPAFSLTASPFSEVPDSGDTFLMMLGALVLLVIFRRTLART